MQNNKYLLVGRYVPYGFIFVLIMHFCFLQMQIRTQSSRGQATKKEDFDVKEPNILDKKYFNRLDQGSVNYDLQTKSCLQPVFVKFYWNTATPICLCISCG